MLTKNRKKLIKSLHQKKYRDSLSLFLIEGEKMVSELLESDLVVEDLYALQRLTESFPSATLISQDDMNAMSAFKNASGVLAVAKQKTHLIDFKSVGDGVVILDNIKDPGNLGTIIRSAEWFGIKDIIVSEETVELYNPKTVQSTMGSLFRQQVYRTNLNDVIKRLQHNGYTVYSAEMDGTDIRKEAWPSKKALVIGSEAHGVSAEIKELTDKSIGIVGQGKAESLNAAVAAAIIISNW